MRILALEASAKAASCALCEDARLVAQSFQNSGLTHSRTLLPMVEDMLKNCGAALGDVDLIAVSAGPGSFTGLRIGVAAAKGLAWALGLPCAGCSSLKSMAWPLAHLAGRELCAVMDARRDQVYCARFLAQGDALLRLSEDDALSIDDLATQLKAPQLLVGDGAELCCHALAARGLDVALAPPHLRWPSAWGVAREGLSLAQAGALTTAEALAPDYHRLSQAERERLAALAGKRDEAPPSHHTTP